MKKILVIDDDKLLRNTVVEVLRDEGYDLVSAENGMLGLKAAMEHLPDLIVSDIMMPVMDGKELLVEIRKNPSLRMIPFIMTTALAERENLRSGMSLGADDYLVKPFNKEELLDAVKIRLEKSEIIREHTESVLDELRFNIIRLLPHEMRTPLNGIIGYGQLLRDHPELFSTEEIATAGTVLYRSGIRLYRLIQNYLLYVRLEIDCEKKKKPELLDDPAPQCLKIATEVAERHERSSDISFETEKCSVYAGEEELLKIVEEIVDNAFKFSEPGENVLFRCGMQDNSFFIEVQDKGKGFAEKDISKIGAYMQFDRAAYEQQGAGLGLIITKRLVDMFDGEICFEQNEGKGSVVKVFIPGEPEV